MVRLVVCWVIVVLLAQACPAAVPRSEHPFPQAVRAEWLNLNGTWEFAETDESADSLYLSEKPYPDTIVVPYCRESTLSGLERKGFVKNVWYRRTFELPGTYTVAASQQMDSVIFSKGSIVVRAYFKPLF